MSRKVHLPQSRHHILVYDEDWEFLTENYGPLSPSQAGVSAIIRLIIHQRVEGLKAKATAEFDKIRDAIGQQATEDR